MAYTAPVNDMMLALKTAGDLDGLIARGIYGSLDVDTIRAVIEEAGKFGAEVLAPLNASGDKAGSKLVDGKVVTPPGWTEAYKAFADGGWVSLPGSERWGGQGLPEVVSMTACEIWNAANLGFGLCPMLSQGAVDALESHGTEELKATYIPKLVSGEWTGTMNLTEPHAGSDLGALRTRAERQPDGTYRIFGTKIFITYGDHEMTPKLMRDLNGGSFMILRNHGVLVCGESVAECVVNHHWLEMACQGQVAALAAGEGNYLVPSEEACVYAHSQFNSSGNFLKGGKDWAACGA